MSLREYFYHQFYSNMEIQIAGQQWRQIVDEMLKDIEKNIDKCKTIEEVKELLK